tara:strand:+ start:408 stop:1229 length:822 start_codon:yes stop_codon:yes gene_type:complete
MWKKKAFQVALFTENDEEFIEQCLKNISNVLKDEDWILVAADNGSADNTMEKISSVKDDLSCKDSYLFKYNKQKNTGAAKNKLFRNCSTLGLEYPLVFYTEPQDIFEPARLKMYDAAQEYENPFIVGAWKWGTRGGNSYWTEEEKGLKSSADASSLLEFPLGATLIHTNILSADPDQPFLNEDINYYEEVLTWYKIRYLVDAFDIIPIDLKDAVLYHVLNKKNKLDLADAEKMKMHRSVFWAAAKKIQNSSMKHVEKLIDQKKKVKQKKVKKS